MNATIHISQSYGGKYHAVTVAPDPWGTETQGPDPRPETAPRCGIVSPRSRFPIEDRIAAIRQFRDDVRAGA